jgi:biotin synthase-like enzyme
VVPQGLCEQLEKCKDGPEFDQVLEMVRTINKLEMEVCCTLGMITIKPIV